MNKNKLQLFIIVGLLISNVLMAAALVLGRPSHRDPQGPKNAIINKLHFDQNQVLKYEQFIDKHRKMVKEKEAELNEGKRMLYSQLLAENNSTIVDSLIANIARTHAQLETIHYNHFLEIKGLCNSTQKQYYEHLTKELEHLFAPKPHPKR